MTLLTDYTLISGSSKLTQFLLACASQIWATPFLQQGKEMDNPMQMDFDSAEKDSWSQWHHSFMVRCARVWPEPLQFNWFRAAMRLYNLLTQCNSSTMRKVLQADMLLSTRSPKCWSSHILSALEGLTQSYMLKQKLLICEPCCWSVSSCSQSVCRRPQGQTFRLLDTFFWWPP